MLYTLLLAAHSAVRWLVLVSLVYAIYRGIRGWVSKSQFSRADGVSRSLASIMVRVQFVIGLVLYFVSPITTYFISHVKEAMVYPDVAFFGMMHVVSMIVAIALVSIGDARSKKASADSKKFMMMTIFYIIGLIIILAAIPWPFSRYASRPYLRGF